MDLGLPAQFIIAFVTVLAMIFVVAWLISRFSGGRALPGSWARGREHRIEVLDATAVDNKRRLVLVRRDHVEHLVLIGGSNDIVVETGIAPPPDVAAARSSANKDAHDKAARKKAETKSDSQPTPIERPAAPPTPPRTQLPLKGATQAQPEAPVVPARPALRPSAPPTAAIPERPAAASPAPNPPQRPTPDPQSAAPAKPSPEAAKPAAEPQPAARSDPSFDDMAKRLEAALKPLDPPSPAPASTPARAPADPPKT